ncbi:hypothetical protein LSO9J_20004 [Candidatus Liberibacter solanacearum]
MPMESFKYIIVIIRINHYNKLGFSSVLFVLNKSIVSFTHDKN